MKKISTLGHVLQKPDILDTADYIWTLPDPAR